MANQSDLSSTHRPQEREMLLSFNWYYHLSLLWPVGHNRLAAGEGSNVGCLFRLSKSEPKIISRTFELITKD